MCIIVAKRVSKLMKNWVDVDKFEDKFDFFLKQANNVIVDDNNNIKL